MTTFYDEWLAAGKRIQEEFRNSPMIAHDDIRLGRALIALGRAGESRKFLQEALEYFTEWLNVVEKNKTAEPRSYVMQTQMLLGLGIASTQALNPRRQQKR